MPPHQSPCRSECQGGHAQLGNRGTWCPPRLWAEAHTDKLLPWPYRTTPLKLATCTLQREAIVRLSWTTTRPACSALRSLTCRCRVALCGYGSGTRLQEVRGQTRALSPH